MKNAGLSTAPFRSPLDGVQIVHRSFTLKKGITKHDALQNQIKNRKDR